MLAEMSDDEKRLEALVPKRLESSAWGMAYEAACLRLALEKGSAFLKAVTRRLRN
jgi:hypothetical protein